MENQIIDKEFNGKSSNGITPEALGFLSEIRKWAKFLSILGFVGVGFMIIVGLLFGSVMSKMNPGVGAANMPTGIFTFIYIIMAAIYFMPILYLYKFSVHLGRSLNNNSSDELTKAFSNLKSHYKFIGILAIILLCLYAVIIIGGIAGALMFANK